MEQAAHIAGALRKEREIREEDVSVIYDWMKEHEEDTMFVMAVFLHLPEVHGEEIRENLEQFHRISIKRPADIQKFTVYIQKLEGVISWKIRPKDYQTVLQWAKAYPFSRVKEGCLRAARYTSTPNVPYVGEVIASLDKRKEKKEKKEEAPAKSRKRSKEASKASGTKFNNYEGRQYDRSLLDKVLLGIATPEERKEFLKSGRK